MEKVHSRNVAIYNNQLDRIINGLSTEGDNSSILKIFRRVMIDSPDVIFPVLDGSVIRAREQLGQDRTSEFGCGPGFLYYPIEAAIKYLAKKHKFFNDDCDPLASSSWDAESATKMLVGFREEIIDLAGSKTIAVNIPQRAVHLMWLIDHVSEIKSNSNLAFIELGASAGLILDGLRNPKDFKKWFSRQKVSLETTTEDFGNKLAMDYYPTLGLDLVSPEVSWVLASTSDDHIRSEIIDFLNVFPERTEVITENIFQLSSNNRIAELLEKRGEVTPFIISCCMLYQLTEEERTMLEKSVRDLLTSYGKGFFSKTDFAVYNGFPDKPDYCTSWIEDKNGSVVSPRVLLSGKTLNKWERYK